MNRDINQRFAVTAEMAFTTQQEMDGFDAQRWFELELSEHWEGLHDLDFESVRTLHVTELPADPNEYAELDTAPGVGVTD